MSSLLESHPLIATRDVDAARTEVAARFCAHRLEPTVGSGSFDMLHNGVDLSEDVSIHFLRYGAEVRITPGCFERFYLLQVPIRGRARIKAGDQLVASDRHTGSLPSPTDPVDMVWSADCEQLMVYLRREAVESHADGRPVRFDARVDLGTPLMRSWLQLLHYAKDDLAADNGLLAARPARSHLAQALICGLLTAQPNSAGLAPVQQTVAPSRAVRAALDLMHDDPARAWRVAELAAGCGVSVRSLQEAFRRERQTTPLAVLRDIRLARAREDLLAAESGNVTDVAGRWGFFHLGRFAQHYQAAYGESPSATLAR